LGKVLPTPKTGSISYIYLRALTFHNVTLDDYSTSLPFVQRILNSNHSDRLKISAAELLFGNVLKLDRGIFLPPSERLAIEGKHLSKHMSDFLKMQDSLLKASAKELLRTDLLHQTQSHDFEESSEGSASLENDEEQQRMRKTNIFNDNLNYKKRKVRHDKLDLSVVRDHSHEVCRMDTFNSSQKIQVHNYDGSFEYHSVHIRLFSLMVYYKMFERSLMYAVWQNRRGVEIIPTIKYRSYADAFCPCCLNQKQRDCTNYHVLKHYTHLSVKQLNIFTDGCAEQYKSRRNAYFIAELAMEHQITVTHNYAPTASFKTMVDGEGDLVKSTYRTLEKNEVEGTRCPTSYNLFELFTSKYPLTPPPPVDSMRRLMTISGRMHRFLIDTVDAITLMRQRAATQGVVIITDYLNERWDAPVLKGIKGLFCLIGQAENNVPKLYSREHACFCKDCMTKNYSDCLYQSTTGVLKAESVMRLPYKEATAKKAPAVGNILERINFFKERFATENVEQTIVAIIDENVQENDVPFKLAMVTKPAKQLRKDYLFECKIDGSDNTITVSKGTWCVTLRFMECKAVENNEYIIPVKAKEIKMPLTNVYFPEDASSCNDHFLIMYTLRSEEVMGQTVNYYSICDESIESIRLSLNGDVE
jgi:hypothetical protein